MAYCPTCATVDNFKKHCTDHQGNSTSPTCDLIECKTCGSYGTMDFKLWQEPIKRK